MTYGLHRRVDVLLALCAAMLLLGAALTRPMLLHGDAGEYLLMGESWFRHGSPEVRMDDLTALERRLKDAGYAFDRDDVLGNYFQGASGRSYCYHAPWYSLLTVGPRALLRRFGLDELRAAPVTNAVLLSAALAGILFWSPAAPVVRRLAAGLLLTSPALAYVRWPHADVYSVALSALALVFFRRGHGPLAVLLAGLASAQTPPVALLAGFFFLAFAARRLRERQWRALAVLALAAVVVLLSPLFFFLEFGTPNMAAYQTADVRATSFGRASELLVDLNVGLLPYVPLTVVLFLWATVRTLRAGRGLDRGLLAVWALMLLVSTAQGNWNHGMSGPSRFVVWTLPIVYDLITLAPGALAGGAWRGVSAVIAAAVVLQGASAWARGGTGGRLDHLQHSAAARFVLDRWPALYSPTHEVFAERTLHTEADFDGPFVYESGGRCRKALARWKHGGELRARCGELPPDSREIFDGRPPKPEKALWVYVDY